MLPGSTGNKIAGTCDRAERVQLIARFDNPSSPLHIYNKENAAITPARHWRHATAAILAAERRNYHKFIRVAKESRYARLLLDFPVVTAACRALLKYHQNLKET